MNDMYGNIQLLDAETILYHTFKTALLFKLVRGKNFKYLGVIINEDNKNQLDLQ